MGTSKTNKPRKLELKISDTQLKLAEERGKEKTICPSEVARTMFEDNWRTHMDDIRTIAFQLRDEGKIMIMQKGQRVQGDNAVGPIRIRIIEARST